MHCICVSYVLKKISQLSLVVNNSHFIYGHKARFSLQEKSSKLIENQRVCRCQMSIEHRNESQIVRGLNLAAVANSLAHIIKSFE